MSLEDLLAENTKALQANTTALLKSGGTGSTSTSTKPAAGGTKVSLEEVVTVLTELKNTHGPAAYKKIMAKFKATKSAELKEADYPAVLKHSKSELARLNEEADAGGADGGDDDDL